MLISNNNTQNNKKFKFLIIEDGSINQQAIKLLLNSKFNSKFNCEVHSVDISEKRILIASSQLFDLIFINIGLIEIDEILAIKKIRQEGMNKYTPIIATSGTIYEEKFLTENGINAFLAKPFFISDFVNTIKKFI